MEDIWYSKGMETTEKKGRREAKKIKNEFTCAVFFPILYLGTSNIRSICLPPFEF